MRERVELVGGSMHVETDRGRGVRLRISVPQPA
jgi:signal transduction histidine kinase